jgi:hypothetical protein
MVLPSLPLRRQLRVERIRLSNTREQSFFRLASSFILALHNDRLPFMKERVYYISALATKSPYLVAKSPLIAIESAIRSSSAYWLCTFSCHPSPIAEAREA